MARTLRRHPRALSQCAFSRLFDHSVASLLSTLIVPCPPSTYSPTRKLVLVQGVPSPHTSSRSVEVGRTVLIRGCHEGLGIGHRGPCPVMSSLWTRTHECSACPRGPSSGRPSAVARSLTRRCTRLLPSRQLLQDAPSKARSHKLFRIHPVSG